MQQLTFLEDAGHIRLYGKYIISFIPHVLSAKLLQLCPTVCNPMDYSPPGSSVHGILQARIPSPMEWVAMVSSRKSSQPSPDNNPIVPMRT